VVNGHEWAKRQAGKAGIGFSEPSNGFATCEYPQALQEICDRLGPADIQAFADRWLAVLPLPLTPADEAAGYWSELSMRQVETSRTIVFDAPRRARAFTEALIADNLDIGRPDSVELIFTGRRPGTPGRPIRNDTLCKTKVVTRDTEACMNAFFKHSRIKQYLKDGRAPRIETVINSPGDLNCHRRLEHLDELQAKARAANARLLDTERVGQGCVLASPAFEWVALSSVTADGRRAPALRFGDPRVMALLGAPCIALNNVVGFTNRSLRAQVSRLLGEAYTRNQMSYDLGRLRLNGAHRPHRAHQHRPAHPGRAERGDLLHQAPPQAAPTAAGRQRTTRPIELRHALATIDRHVQHTSPTPDSETPPENSRSTSACREQKGR
jgi:hypothetical protein